MRDAAGELDDLHAADDFAARIVQHLAMLAGNDARQRIGMPLEQFAETEEDPRPAQGRGRCPAFQGGGGRCHRGIDVGAAGQRHAPGDPAGGRIEDLGPAPPGAGEASSANVMFDRRDDMASHIFRHGSLLSLSGDCDILRYS